jgi:hypothetical protein
MLDPAVIYHVLQTIAVILIYARRNGISPVICVSVYLPYVTSKQVKLEESLFIPFPDLVLLARLGEELTFEYGVESEFRGDTIFHCLCGAETCTGFMGRSKKLGTVITRHPIIVLIYSLLFFSQVSSLNESSPSLSSGSNGMSNGRQSNKTRIRSSNLTGEQDVDTCFGCGLTDVEMFQKIPPKMHQSQGTILSQSFSDT